MKKTCFFRVLLLLALFSAFVNANSTLGIAPTCYCGNQLRPCDMCPDAETIKAPRALNSLEHGNFYIWEIDELPIPDGYRISQAGLSIYGINDWQVENDDKLFIHLLSKSDIDAISAGMSKTAYGDNYIYIGQDNPADGDAFNGYGNNIVDGSLYYEDKSQHDVTHTYTYYVWEQHNGRWVRVKKTKTYTEIVNDPENLCYHDELTALLKGTSPDVIGIGFDADCWFRPYTRTDWIKFWYCTERIPLVPAPGAIVLGGIGVSLVGWLRRRRTF